MRLGLGIGRNRNNQNGNGGGITKNLSSFVWHSEEFAFGSAGFNESLMSTGYTANIILAQGTESTGTDKTIFSTWNNTGNLRGTVLRFTDLGEIEYFSSQDGLGVDVRVKTTATFGNDVMMVSIVHDSTQANSGTVAKIYVNGVLEPTSTVSDTGDYSIYSTPAELTIGAFYLTNVLSRFYRGWMNQFAITSDKQTAVELLALWNSGAPLDFENNISNLLIYADMDNATFGTKYTIPDTVNGNDFVQNTLASSQRTGIKSDYLNPYGVSYPTTTFAMDGTNMYQFDDQTGASFSFTNNLEFALDHTGGSDPDRNSCEVLSKGSYDISSQELWVRFNNYDWNASVDVMSHGGFSIIDDRNDLTFLMITHRVIAPNLAFLGTYRVLKALNGVQTESFPNIAKGKDVFIKIDGTTCEFHYNNAGVLTLMWSTTLDLGNWVRIKAHARDYNAYSSPETYGTDLIKVYRTTPTDL